MASRQKLAVRAPRWTKAIDHSLNHPLLVRVPYRRCWIGLEGGRRRTNCCHTGLGHQMGTMDTRRAQLPVENRAEGSVEGDLRRFCSRGESATS